MTGTVRLTLPPGNAHIDPQGGAGVLQPPVVVPLVIGDAVTDISVLNVGPVIFQLFIVVPAIIQLI